MLERIEVRNHSMTARTVELAIRLTGDFADVLEIAQERRQQEGELSVASEGESVAIRYRAAHRDRHTERGLRLRTVSGQVSIGSDGSTARATASIALEPRGCWIAELAYEPLVDGTWLLPDGAAERWDAARADREAWRRGRTRLRSTSPTLQTAWEFAADDLYALRNRELEEDDHQHGS